MEEDQESPLIIGRPFLATSRALIDVQGGQLTFRVDDEEVMFDMYLAIKSHESTNTCLQVESLML